MLFTATNKREILWTQRYLNITSKVIFSLKSILLKNPQSKRIPKTPK